MPDTCRCGPQPSDTRPPHSGLRQNRSISGLSEMHAAALYRQCPPASLEPDNQPLAERFARAPRAATPPRRQARDKLAPPHSITSSARASREGGMSMLSNLAVLRLTTNSSLVDCS